MYFDYISAFEALYCLTCVRNRLVHFVDIYVSMKCTLHPTLDYCNQTSSTVVFHFYLAL